jgi:hypothetical protein
MRSIIPTMEAAGVRRIVTLTGNIAQAPKESFTIWNQLVHGFLAAAAPQVAQDAESHMQLLANSALDWTAVRSPAMVNGSNAAYRLTDTVSIWGTIPRKAVAASILDLVASRDYIGKAPLVRRRSD